MLTLCALQMLVLLLLLLPVTDRQDSHATARQRRMCQHCNYLLPPVDISALTVTSFASNSNNAQPVGVDDCRRDQLHHS